MTARDAIDRLNRTRAVGARMTLPSGHTFTTGHDSFPDRAPLDHVEIAPGDRVLQVVTVPGTEHSQRVCENWPGCNCQGDCDEHCPQPWPLWLKLAGLALALAIAIGLFVTGARHG